MRTLTATEPGSSAANEDWYSTSSNLIVVIDGATTRTETGCTHGTAWYVARLGAALGAAAVDPSRSLRDALATAIRAVAADHSACDLNHLGTPSAAVAAIRWGAAGRADYVLLGDVTIAHSGADGQVQVLVDDRVNSTARNERDIVNQYPIGSVDKAAALIVMKHAELAVRNTPGGYWVAAAEPSAASHALAGTIDTAGLRRVAVLTDGATRAVDSFDLLDWPALLDVIEKAGPAEVIRFVRSAERTDPDGTRWPRNKQSDDATVVFATWD